MTNNLKKLFADKGLLFTFGVTRQYRPRPQVGHGRAHGPVINSVVLR